MGADGIKTGFLTVEQYSLAASIKVNERRITAVASGFKSKNSRSRESIRLLNWGLRKFDTIQIAKKDEIFTSLKVWLGKKNNVEVISSEDVYLTIPKRKKKTIKAELIYNGPIEAPIKKGEKLALLNIYVSGELQRQVDIFSSEEILFSFISLLSISLLLISLLSSEFSLSSDLLLILISCSFSMLSYMVRNLIISR